MYCGKCGRKTKEGNLYCTKCGERVPDETGRMPYNAEDNGEQIYRFTKGDYWVGKAVPVGKYNIVWSSGRGTCAIYDKHGNIMFSELFGDNAFRRFECEEVRAGGIITIDSNLIVEFILNQDTSVIQCHITPE